MRTNTIRLLSLMLVFALLIPVVALAQDATPEALMNMGQMMSAGSTCSIPSGLSGTITLGAVFALSGSASVYGVSQQNAVNLAVQDINGSGYLGGATLAVTFEDSAGDRNQAITAMTKLVTEDQVTAVIGPTLSSEALAADPVAQENSTVVLGVSNTASGITEMGNFVFRDSLPEASVIPGTIATAIQTLGLTKVGVLYGNDDDFTVGGYNVFKQELEKNGVTISDTETFAKGDTDFSAQLTNILGQSPDAIVVSALAAEATQIITQARSQGWTGPIIGGNGFNSPAILTNSGAASEGVIVGAAWNQGSPNAMSQGLIAEYTAANGNGPDQFAVQAYTGTWLLATAIRCANSADHTAIRDALAGIKDFASPLGNFSFDENRNPVHEPVVQIVKDGKFAVLAGMNPSATPEATAAG
jgi:branched-chain amino acid transport system substrate-binding protein